MVLRRNFDLECFLPMPIQRERIVTQAITFILAVMWFSQGVEYKYCSCLLAQEICHSGITLTTIANPRGRVGQGHGNFKYLRWGHWLIFLLAFKNSKNWDLFQKSYLWYFSTWNWKNVSLFRMTPFKVKTCDDPMSHSGSNY